MTTEPRKASDVLLELESKLDIALNIIRTQDLNIKILSNKLNSILIALEKQEVHAPQITVEAVNTSNASMSKLDVEKNITISSEFKLPVENEPKGFRRTSRPETFAGDDDYLHAAPTVTPKYPVQIPQASANKKAEVIVPTNPRVDSHVTSQPKQTTNITQNVIPVMQRVVNKQGKSLFLADVEIIDLASMQQVFKTRTNGTGKWMASLGVGDYRVIIRKLESITKEKMEATQDIKVDGNESPFELPTIIIK